MAGGGISIAHIRARFFGILPPMKLEWKERFITLVRQSKGDRSEVDYARFLGIKRQSLQRILSGRHRIDYSNVEIALRKLGVCHCVIVNLDCPHKRNLNRSEMLE